MLPAAHRLHRKARWRVESLQLLRRRLLETERAVCGRLWVQRVTLVAPSQVVRRMVLLLLEHLLWVKGILLCVAPRALIAGRELIRGAVACRARRHHARRVRLAQPLHVRRREYRWRGSVSREERVFLWLILMMLLLVVLLVLAHEHRRAGL